MEDVYTDLLRADMDSSSLIARFQRKRQKAARLGCLTAAVAVFRARDAVKRTHDLAVSSLAALLPPIYRMAASWDPAVDTTNDAIDALVNLFYEGAHLKTSASFHAVVVVPENSPVPESFSPLPSPVVFGSPLHGSVSTASPVSTPASSSPDSAASVKRATPKTPNVTPAVTAPFGSPTSICDSLDLARTRPMRTAHSYTSSLAFRRVSSANLPMSPLSVPSSRYSRLQRRWTRQRAEFKQKREAAKAAKEAKAEEAPPASPSEPIETSEPEPVRHKLKLPWRRSVDPPVVPVVA